jgi:bifunctional oligoribonuclease and PAP phosphatase NrnA
MTTLKKKNKKDNIEIVLKQIELSQKIIITTHINPDGDAIGSVVALLHYLIQKEKEVILISYNEVPSNLKFVIGAELIEVYDNYKHDIQISTADLIIVTDLNEIDRLKTVGEVILKSSARKCIIDHHVEPKQFADYYLIDSKASSTCEILYNLFKKDKKFQMTPEIALAIYTGIMTDTGGFRFSNTNRYIFKIAADLMKYNVNPAKVYDEVYNTLSFNGLNFWERLFQD